MPRDFLPGNDEKLDRWMQQFVAALGNYHESLGISAADVAVCQADCDTLSAALEDFTAKQSAARAATVVKDGAREQAVANVRKLARRLQAAPGINDTLRVLLGLTVPRPAARRLAPESPESLVVSVRPDGRILLRWDKGGNRPGVTYLIESKSGGAANWQMAGFSTKTRFVSADDVAAGTLWYRVRALRGESVSLPSGEAVVGLV